MIIAVLDRIARRFARYEPLRHAGVLMAGWSQVWIARIAGPSPNIGVRPYVIDAFGDQGAILVVGETGDVKKGTRWVGVQRQYAGTAGRIENSQVAVYLAYAAPRGHALIDRALYLLKSWTEIPDRCADVGNLVRAQGFSTKPRLARTLIARAVQAKIPAGWVGGDEVGGADPHLRVDVRTDGLGYVLAIAANRRVPTHAGPIRVDNLPALIPAHAWQTHSAGAGAHGPRLYSGAWFRLLPEDDTDTGVYHLLIRRNDSTGEHAYPRCYSPRPVPLATLVAAAGQRWRIEESFQAAKGLVGLDQHQVRRWTSGFAGPLWPCSPTRSWPSPAPPDATPPPPPAGLIALTVNEFRRLFEACC